MRALPLLLALSLLTVGCASNTLEAREARGEKRAEQLDSLLRKAEQLLDALEPEEGEKLLAKAKDLLGDAELALSPEKGLLERRYQEDLDRLPAVRAARAKRDHDLAVAERKSIVDKAATGLDAAMGDLSLQKPTKEAVALAKKALDELASAIADGKALENDKAYVAWLDKPRKRHSESTTVVALAADLEQFLSGPCDKLREAREKVAAAKAAPASEPKPRVDALTVAVEKLKACGDEGKASLSRNGLIAPKPLSFGDGTITPTAAVAACAAEQKDAEKRLEVERKALAVWIKKQEAAERARLKAEAAAKAKAEAAEKARLKAEAAAKAKEEAAERARQKAEAAKAAKAAKKK